MDFALFWLPIIGGILLGGVAVAAWYGGNKVLAVWAAFFGVVFFLLTAALQFQNMFRDQGIPKGRGDDVGTAISNALSAQRRPWVKLDVSAIGPIYFEEMPANGGSAKIAGGIFFPFTFSLENTGEVPATNIHVTEEISPGQDIAAVRKATQAKADASAAQPGGAALFPKAASRQSYISPLGRDIVAKAADGCPGQCFILMIAVRYDYPGGHGKTELAYMVSHVGPLTRGIPIGQPELMIARANVADVAE